MNAETFNAYLSTFNKRFPWTEQEALVAKDYRDRLWIRCCLWSGDEERRFKSAIEEMVASRRYGRPTVAEIVAMVIGSPDTEKATTVPTGAEIAEGADLLKKHREAQAEDRRERVRVAMRKYSEENPR